jgi:hypothetical protein
MGRRGRAPTRSRPAAEIPLCSAGLVVDCGSLAVGHHLHESIGGKPRPVPASGRDRPARILLLGVPCRSARRPRGQSASAAEGPLGNSVGAIGWPRGPLPFAQASERISLEVGQAACGRAPSSQLLCPSGRAVAAHKVAPP